MSSLKDVNIEDGKVEVELFSKTEAALAYLRQQYSTFPALDTEEGYEYVKAGINELVSLRTSLEKERKRIKQPYLDAGSIIDTEAKRITEQLVELETPMKAAKKVIDDREKRLKEERLARLAQKIEEIRAHAVFSRDTPSDDIAKLIEAVDSIDTLKDFFELSMEAEKARQDTLEKLNGLYSDRLAFERAEEDRKKAEAEAAELRKAQDLAERLNKLRMIPVDLFGKSSNEIKSKIASLKNYPPQSSDFGDRHYEAEETYKKILSQLGQMFDQAVTLEEVENRKRQEEHEAKQKIIDENKKLEERVTRNPFDEKPSFIGVDMAKSKDEHIEAVVDPDVRIVITCTQSNSSAILSMMLDQFAVDITGDDITGFEVKVTQ
jgi:hypothetical protein